jgi:hypothetical protein
LADLELTRSGASSTPNTLSKPTAVFVIVEYNYVAHIHNIFSILQALLIASCHIFHVIWSCNWKNLTSNVLKMITSNANTVRALACLCKLVKIINVVDFFAEVELFVEVLICFG